MFKGAGERPSERVRSASEVFADSSSSRGALSHDVDKDALYLTASVTSKGFKMGWREPEFYKDNAKYAKDALVLADKGYFDEQTVSWFNKLKPVLLGLSELNGIDEKDFSKNHRSAVFKLTKKHGDKAIYGKDGAFQFLKALSMIEEARPSIAGIASENFNGADLKLNKLTLLVSKDGEESGRLVRAADDLTSGFSNLQEFCKFYEIKDESKFLADISKLDGYLEKPFLDLIENPGFWNSPDALGMFDQKNGKVLKAYSDFANFIKNYRSFFSKVDSTHSSNLKYQKIFYYLSLRFEEFSSKHVEDKSLSKNLLKSCYNNLLKGIPNFSGDDDFMGRAAEFMMEHDEGQKNAEWTELYNIHKTNKNKNG